MAEHITPKFWCLIWHRFFTSAWQPAWGQSQITGKVAYYDCTQCGRTWLG